MEIWCEICAHPEIAATVLQHLLAGIGQKATAKMVKVRSRLITLHFRNCIGEQDRLAIRALWKPRRTANSRAAWANPVTRANILAPHACKICAFANWEAVFIEGLSRGETNAQVGMRVGASFNQVRGHLRSHITDGTRRTLQRARRPKRRCAACAREKVVLAQLLLGNGVHATGRRIGLTGRSISVHLRRCISPELRTEILKRSRANRGRQISDGWRRAKEMRKQRPPSVYFSLAALRKEAASLFAVSTWKDQSAEKVRNGILISRAEEIALRKKEGDSKTERLIAYRKMIAEEFDRLTSNPPVDLLNDIKLSRTVQAGEYAMTPVEQERESLGDDWDEI